MAKNGGSKFIPTPMVQRRTTLQRRLSLSQRQKCSANPMWSDWGKKMSGGLQPEFVLVFTSHHKHEMLGILALTGSAVPTSGTGTREVSPIWEQNLK